jgi:ketosteroid isomerase-like protein
MRHSIDRHGRKVLCAALIAIGGIAIGWAAREAGSAEAADDDMALAQTQLARFYDALTGKAELADVLGDAFQIMGTDGTRYDRAGYVARHPSYSSYKLSDLTAIRSGDVLTASYFAAVNGEVEETGGASGGDPRLAVFAKAGDQWKLQSIANLGLGLGLASNPEAEGKNAIAGWVGAVVSGDLARVKAVIAPEFQIVRADGSAFDAAGYLASTLPKFDKPPAVKNPVVTGFGDYLIARYVLATDKGDAPRLTIFRKSGTTWLVVAHANFAGLAR